MFFCSLSQVGYYILPVTTFHTSPYHHYHPSHVYCRLRCLQKMVFREQDLGSLGMPESADCLCAVGAYPGASRRPCSRHSSQWQIDVVSSARAACQKKAPRSARQVVFLADGPSKTSRIWVVTTTITKFYTPCLTFPSIYRLTGWIGQRYLSSMRHKRLTLV